MAFWACVSRCLLGRNTALQSGRGPGLAWFLVTATGWHEASWVLSPCGGKVQGLMSFFCPTQLACWCPHPGLVVVGPADIPGSCPLEWVSSDLHERGCGGSQSCEQLFISHLMTTLLLCNYVLRIYELIQLGFGEIECSCYLYGLLSLTILPCPKCFLSP